MTWDHIEMVLSVGLASGLVAVAVGLGVAVVTRFDNPWAAILAFLVSGAASAPLVAATIADRHMSANDEDYPPMVEAFKVAAPHQQLAMRRVILEAGGRREVFSMSRAQRDRFLVAGNFCTQAAYPGCRPLPASRLDQGGAIEMFPSLGATPRPCFDVPERPSCP